MSQGCLLLFQTLVWDYRPDSQFSMQAARAQLDQQTSPEGVTGLLDLMAAFAGPLHGSSAGLIAYVVLASNVADDRPIVSAVAAAALQGEASCLLLLLALGPVLQAS